MKKLLFLCLILLVSSCGWVTPGIEKDLDDAITDQVVRVEIDKDAIQKDTDIEITVRVTNKDAENRLPNSKSGV